MMTQERLINCPILVLEDSDEDFDTVQEAAQHAHLTNRFHRATTGDECLDLLCSNQGMPIQPGLVILDLNTPGTDGREALREIRADQRLRGLPVIVLSTSANPRDLAYCYQTGANAYHVKPVRHADHVQVLLDLFAYWLGRVILMDRDGGPM